VDVFWLLQPFENAFKHRVRLVGRAALFLHNFDVLDHVEAITRDEFAFHGDRLGRREANSELIGLCSPISRYVLPSSALRPTGRPSLMHICAQYVLGVGPAVRIMVDVADHIDDFAADGDFFTRRFARLAFVFFALVGERWKCCKGSRNGE
jgi:hypothetical protein